MCIWDGAPIRPEGEREDNAYWESEGDLPFLSGDGEEWRLGPMSPEEKMYRDMIDKLIKVVYIRSAIRQFCG